MTTGAGGGAGAQRRVGLLLRQRYRLDSVLGKGGMATAYRATDLPLDRTVVAKIPHADLLDDPDARRRFDVETRALVALRHRSVVSVLDAGVSEHDEPFLILDFLAGGSLHDRLKGGRVLAIGELGSWVPDLAAAIDFAHANGILHRDIKPGNVLFDAQGFAYLSDFGIAKVLDRGEGAESGPKSSKPWWSPDYASPEFPKEGFSEDYDRYAFAVLVYEALAGRRPHRVDTTALPMQQDLELVRVKLETPAAPLAKVAPQVPAHVAEVVEAALDRDPSKRYASCVAFAQALMAPAVRETTRRAVIGGEKALRTAGRPAPRKSAPKPRPLASRLAMGLLLLVIGGGATYLATRDGAGSSPIPGASGTTPVVVADAGPVIEPPNGLPSWAKVSKFQLSEAKRLQLEPTLEIAAQGLRFVLIPPGTFTMGSPDSELERDPDEGRPHLVTLTKPYYLGVAEVTNRQYRRFDPGHEIDEYQGESLNGDDQPVVNVSAEDAVNFAAWLRAQDPVHECRLPTEAEWEYACRSGTTTSRWWGGDDAGAKGKASVLDTVSKARFDLPWNSFGFDDGFRTTAPVATFEPNPWGLHDMLGNAWEWCSDWRGGYASSAVTDPTGPSTGTWRVLRGGSWNFDPKDVRAACRYEDVAVGRANITFGFRLVVSVRPR